MSLPMNQFMNNQMTPAVGNPYYNYSSYNNFFSPAASEPTYTAFPGQYFASPNQTNKSLVNNSLNSSGYVSNFESPYGSTFFATNTNDSSYQNNFSSKKELNVKTKGKKQRKLQTTKPTDELNRENNNNLINSYQEIQQMIDDDDFSDYEDYEDQLTENAPKKKRVLNQDQRVAANIRERKRMNIMNEAFVNLRAILPIRTGRKRRKMSRLDIVIGAMEYIDYLDSILETGKPPSYSDNIYGLF